MPGTLFENINHTAMESLNRLAAKAIDSFLPAAVRSRSFFINDVPADLVTESDPEWISTMVSGLLSMVVNQVSRSCIRVTARQYSRITVFKISQEGANSYLRNYEWRQLHAIAEKQGGTLYISSGPGNATMLSFSFPQEPVCAAGEKTNN